MKENLTLGVIGGLGPMATAYFMELVTRMTDAACDQEHLEMIVYSRPSTPDRTGFLLGESKADPLPDMIELGRRLREQNAACIAIPCITAHCFHQKLQEGIGMPVLHAVRDTVAQLRRGGVKRAGIMATDGTVRCGIFQQELEAAGIAPVLPSAEGQAAVMHLIYDCVKAGRAPDLPAFARVREELRAAGAEVIILGCTELSVLKGSCPLGDGLIDALEVLAKSAIETCGGRVRAEYETLFSTL